MAITIYQKLVKSFPLQWQHHRLMSASTIVPIIQSLTNGVHQFGKATPGLDASLLQCTLRSACCTGDLRKVSWFLADGQKKHPSQNQKRKFAHGFAIVRSRTVAADFIFSSRKRNL